MKNFRALVVDYDGTIATLGQVAPPTVAALRRVRDSGRILILATGRILSELLENFPEIHIFHRVVAEDGALIYDPATHSEELLAQAPPKEFHEALAKQKVAFQIGKVIIGTHKIYLDVIQSVIQAMRLPLEVSFNKSSLMILPRGVDKATGVAETLGKLGIDPKDAVGIGDAENDLAFLKLCGLSVTLANAVPILQDTVDKVMPYANGEGVQTLIEELLVKQPKAPAPAVLPLQE